MANTFSNIGANAAEKYVALMNAAMEAMASGDANWEKMQDYVKKGYSAKLTQLASTQNFKDLDTYDVEENIAKAKG
jgi:hypothetical protein